MTKKLQHTPSLLGNLPTSLNVLMLQQLKILKLKKENPIIAEGYIALKDSLICDLLITVISLIRCLVVTISWIKS